MFPYVCQPQETLQLVQTQNPLSRKQKCLQTNSEAFWWHEQFHARRFLKHFQPEKQCFPARLGLHKQIVTKTPPEYIRVHTGTHEYIRVTYGYIPVHTNNIPVTYEQHTK